MNNLHIKILLLSLVLFTISFAQDKFKLTNNSQTDTNSVSKKIPIAIMKFDGNGVTNSDVKTLSDRLRLEIFRNDIYEIIEREKMKLILNEMQFQLSDCTSDECAVEVGKLIGVEKIIIGTISKFGNLFSISARLIDVETGKLEATAIHDIESSLGLGKVLITAIPSVANQLCGIKDPQIKTPVIVEKNKDTKIKIYTAPIGANIFINNIYKGISPVTLTVSHEETLNVRLELPGYEIYNSSYNLREGEIKELSLFLEKIQNKSKTSKKNQELKNQDTNDYQQNKNKWKKGNIVKYSKTQYSKRINSDIEKINNLIAADNILFDKVIDNNQFFNNIKSMNGLEFLSTNRLMDNVAFEYGIGIYRQEFESWISDFFSEDKDEEKYSIVYWSPQININSKFNILPNKVVNPFFSIGYAYNLLLMTAYRDEKSLNGLTYQSHGFVFSGGIEIKPFGNNFGIAVEWNRRIMEMEAFDNDYLDNFKSHNLDKINLTGNSILFSLNFYHK